jgi:hypothetical protein
MLEQPAIDVDFAFVPAGTMAEPSSGRLFVDVGNGFGPGLLDHHGPGTPGACTARLVLDHPEYVLSQVDASRTVTIFTHRYPDLDAISGVYLARAHLKAEPIDDAARVWAGYVDAVDQGYTRLDPAQPLNPYSVMMMRMARIAKGEGDADLISRRMLEAGLDLVALMLGRIREGRAVDSAAMVEGVSELSEDVQAVLADRAIYLTDLERAEQLVCGLPRQDGSGTASVPGIWVDRPQSELFKSWARGDTQADSRPDGYVFSGVQLSDSRAILSVAPDSGVTLKGLGPILEAAETAKRDRLGCPRTGANRKGFDSPDPWYDGRSAFHGYTIVDAPMAGTVLSPDEIRLAFDDYLRLIAEGG